MDDAIILVLMVVGFVVLVFQAYLWILLARLMRLGCKFLKAQLEYYHSDCGILPY